MVQSRRVAAHYAMGGTIAINGGEPAPIAGVAESFVEAFPVRNTGPGEYVRDP